MTDVHSLEDTEPVELEEVDGDPPTPPEDQEHHSELAAEDMAGVEVTEGEA